MKCDKGNWILRAVMGTGLGMVCAWLICTIFAAIIAGVAVNSGVENMEIAIMLAQLLSSFVCVLLASKVAGKNILLVSMIAASCNYGGMLCVVLLLDSRTSGLGKGALVSLAGAVLACLVSAWKPGKKRSRRNAAL